MATKIMLIACGSFNPCTPMHFRMFGKSDFYFSKFFYISKNILEIAKDHFEERGITVIGGIVSPVHDSYGKKGLVSQTHRLAMITNALQTSSWIRISDWECQQESWTRTRNTLQYHQNYLNSLLSDLNGVNLSSLPSWLPENVKYQKSPIQIKLLCGADLLESFATPGLWDPDDLEAILGQHGLVVISRSCTSPEKFIFESDLLSKYSANITVVTNWVANDVSSTLARRFISRGRSVKYLLDDAVIDYINKHQLYRGNFET